VASLGENRWYIDPCGHNDGHSQEESLPTGVEEEDVAAEEPITSDGTFADKPILTSPALSMNASAAIADSLLRRAFGWQARRSLPRRTVQVRLEGSRLRMPVSPRDCAISPRTVMNNVG
jgi:hypothetical protein